MSSLKPIKYSFPRYATKTNIEPKNGDFSKGTSFEVPCLSVLGGVYLEDHPIW